MNHTILIIDDEKEIVNLLGEFLTKKGFRAILCLGGEEGISRIKEGVEFDLVILDSKMPKVDGAAVLALLHKERKGVPVIMLTGSLDWQLKHKPARPPDKLLIKPLDLFELLRAVKEILTIKEGS